MMMNLFSSFDPSTYLNSSFNWLSTMILILLLPNLFWLIPSRMNILNFKITNFLNNELNLILKNNKFNNLIFLSIFIFIIINNFMGLFPYIFTSTSHMVCNLSLALPLWLSLMFFGWIKNLNHMFTHLVPLGTPNILMPFMVLIESISNIIRPWTLAVRLTANMIAGHLLLTLLGNLGENLNFFQINFLIITQFLLLLLEFSVAMIQAYVFMILGSLYSSEIK
uniref:ATP synthase subunit a n=1 Tax=Cucujoidea sp. 22 KM-2017 TaxID=2219359 RepID=A0A346RI87_9CUCU|nr:ATP synthase F0 subunit 6 [Cucujoidea sp. 22 KM-2017]